MGKSRVKKLFQSLSLRERADERSSSGEVKPLGGGNSSAPLRSHQFSLLRKVVVALSIASLSALFAISPAKTCSAYDLDDPYINVELSGIPNFYPGASSTEVISSNLNAAVETNVRTGYDITISSGSTDTAMLPDDTSKNPGKINTTMGTSATPSKLEINTYGYSMDTTSNDNDPIWIGLKPSNGTPDLIYSSDKPRPTRIPIRFGARVDVNKMKDARYSVVVAITATAKLPPATFGPSTDDYGTDGKVQVDYDEHMIPVKYTGNEDKAQWTSLTYQEIADNPKDWYNYPEKQWANAVTVKADKLADYQNKSAIVKEEDVLGYWVYIPRYEYKVRSISGSNIQSAANFDIRFQTSGQKTPLNNGEVKVDTYATHPAFTWGNEELNGIWVGKFETTGSTKAPTILPNQYHNAYKYVGVFYDIAKSVGVKDDSNPYGNSTETTQNSHNLNNAATHMLKNSEWGAVAYLSSSKYGAGVNNVQLNASKDNGTGSNDSDGKDSASITGCGPKANGDTANYDCSGDITHQYQSALGQLASTTGNTYGVYDMSGGANEYAMGNWTDTEGKGSTGTGSANYFTSLPNPPYVDLYFNIDSNSQCTWLTCGGDALYETAGWGGDRSGFASSKYSWFLRGGSWEAGSALVGLFYSNYGAGDGGLSSYHDGFRVSLLSKLTP